MRKIIAFLMSVIMMTSLFFTNVMATTSVTLSNMYLDSGEFTKDVYVYLTPDDIDGVESGAYATITIDEGTFYKDSCEVAYTSDVGKGYDEYIDALNDYYDGGEVTANMISSALGTDIDQSANLPYKIKYINDQEIQVFLFPVDKSLVKSGNGLSKSSDVTYNIPVVCLSNTSDANELNIQVTGNTESFIESEVVSEDTSSSVKPIGNGTDAIVILDTSGSMENCDESTGISRAEGAKKYVDGYVKSILANPKSRVALITFGNSDIVTEGAKVELEFIKDYSLFNTTLESLKFEQDENMGKALEYAKQLVEEQRINKNVEILIVTDAFPLMGKTKTADKFEQWMGYVGSSVVKRAEWIYDYVKNELPSDWSIRTQGVYYGLDENGYLYNFAVDFLSAIANPPGNTNLDIVYKEYETETTTETTTETIIETTTKSGGSSSGKAVKNDDKEAVEEEVINNEVIDREDIYIYGELKDFPLIDTYNINNIESAILAVENTIDLINTDKFTDINDEMVQYELANFIDEAIGLSVTASIPEDGIITKEFVSALEEQAKANKADMEALLTEKGVLLSRDLLTSITIKADDEIQISSDLDTISIDNLHIDMGIDGARITLGKNFLEDNMLDEPLVLSFAAEGAETEDNEELVNEEVAAANVNSGKFTTNYKLNTPVTLSLSILPDKELTYQGVKGPEGYAVSMPNASTRKVQFRATQSGTYTVTNVDKLNFTDVNSLSQAQQDTLRRLYAHGLIEGKSATSFAPNTTLTRAEFTTLLLKTIGQYDPTYKGVSGFVDMNGHWASSMVSVAKKLGIVAGYDSDNTFRPDNKINNEQLYHILGVTYSKVNPRAKVSTGVINSMVAKFNDGTSIAQWARENVAISVNANIYPANQSGKFNSKNEVTRLNSAIAIGKLFEISPFEGNWK